MSETGIVVSEEQQESLELHETLTKMNARPKLALWAKYFFDRANKKTYGNKTQSAMAAYSLDPETQYWSAAKIGQENYKKLSIFATGYYDADGMTVAKVLDLIAVHAVAGKAKALEMLAILTDVYNPKLAQITINNTQNNTNTITNVKADDPRISQLNKDFQEFIEAKYNKKTPEKLSSSTQG